MKKPNPRIVEAKGSGSTDRNIGALLERVRGLIRAARKSAATTINSLQVITSYEVGRMIVEYEQQGIHRAEYGKLVLKTLSERLTAEFGRGFSEDNLSNMRKFYLVYKDRVPAISEKASRKSISRETIPPTLSWSHYVFLSKINDVSERHFYEIEASGNNWSLPELKRQFDSSLYERLALSRDKEKIRELSEKGQLIARPEDMMKNPLVLEFLGLSEKSEYSETDLETAIIDKIEHFLLELGKGFLFEARQKRFSFDSDHYFVDLVFYNRLLRCYVLIDLKIGKLTHQDLGQMQMYVNYYDRYVKTGEEHPTVGIVICKTKKNTLVELTLPKDAQIYASEYRFYLPSKKELRQKMMEWAIEAESQNQSGRG
jgi:predicted nuclease of restriction endonuclease-like (RecB) superfamily